MLNLNAYFDVTIPSTIRRIGDNAFNCASTDITFNVKFEGDAPELPTNAFGDVKTRITYSRKYPAYEKLVEEFKAAGKTNVIWTPVGSASENQAGENITWHYEGSKLVFSGSGAMYDYTKDTLPDWDLDGISVVEFDDDITTIGDYAFYSEASSTNKATSIDLKLPSSLERSSSLEGMLAIVPMPFAS